MYVPEVLAVGLTPTSWTGYMRQQARWTRSVLDIKLREELREERAGIYSAGVQASIPDTEFVTAGATLG